MRNQGLGEEESWERSERLWRKKMRKVGECDKPQRTLTGRVTKGKGRKKEKSSIFME